MPPARTNSMPGRSAPLLVVGARNVMELFCRRDKVPTWLDESPVNTKVQPSHVKELFFSSTRLALWK